MQATPINMPFVNPFNFESRDLPLASKQTLGVSLSETKRIAGALKSPDELNPRKDDSPAAGTRTTQKPIDPVSASQRARRPVPALAPRRSRGHFVRDAFDAVRAKHIKESNVQLARDMVSGVRQLAEACAYNDRMALALENPVSTHSKLWQEMVDGERMALCDLIQGEHFQVPFGGPGARVKFPAIKELDDATVDLLSTLSGKNGDLYLRPRQMQRLRKQILFQQGERKQRLERYWRETFGIRPLPK
ncbi:hypothetical protein OIV83_005016 [Microbotryomycetes sp. JL201]|nr:hypothetical protein OIV83_005016 [Microbotryomycetes sp. JL201]